MKITRILTSTLASLLIIGCTSSQQPAEGLKMLVGTYTDGNSSLGAYLYEFNEDELSFTLLDTAKAGNPSFIIADNDLSYAYSVSEYNTGEQSAVSYKLTGNSIDVLNSQSAVGSGTGADPCNILLTNGSIITSNYTGGTVTAFPVLEDGTLGRMSYEFAPGGEDGLTHHMHCTILSPDGKYVFTNDLGADRIWRFTLGNPAQPLTDPQIAFQFDTEEHPGPRHSVFSEDGRYLYLIHELGDILSVFSYENGGLTLISSVLAYDGEGHGSADIHITPDGKFLYTSHRLKDDGISVFKINKEDGTVTNVGYTNTGIHPRNFAITPDGKYLLCACRDSNDIEIFEINPETGLLTDTGAVLEIPAPVCIQFL